MCANSIITNFYWSDYMKSILLLTILFPICLLAQVENPLEYFPIKTGNMWEYYFDDLQYPDTVQVFNIKDSVDSEGNIYLTQFARRINPVQYPLLFPDTATYKIDTSFNVFGPGPKSKNDLLYKLNANEGELWVIYDYAQVGGNGYEIGRLKEVWQDELFGKLTTFKYYDYYYASDSTDTLGLDRSGVILAKGFGVWWIGGGDAIADDYLKGCVINDTLYGDTTNIITSIKDLTGNFPVQLELFQNYPNPFNPTTNIIFQIKETGFVSLKVHDILGKEVANLINEEKEAGTYEIFFDGAKLPSGIYFYSISAGVFHQTKKMLLIK